MLGNVLILNFNRVFDEHTFQDLSGVRATGDSASAAKGFEYSFVNFTSLFIHLNLKLHDITTSRGSNEAGTNVLILLVEGTDISGVLVVVNDTLVVCKHPVGSLSDHHLLVET